VLREQDITPGKFYVNNGRRVAREVLRVKDQVIVFNTHHLHTGNSCGSPSECSRQDFTKWADHEASPSEVANVQYQSMNARIRTPQSFG